MKQNNSSINTGDKTGRDYRFIAFSVVTAYAALMVFSEFYFGTYGRIIKYLGIYPIPYFIDMQVVLTGIDAVRQGIDPYSKEASSHLSAGHYNYPLSWTWLSFLPFLKVSNSFVLGFALLLLLFTTLYFFIGPVTLRESLAYAILFTSSAFMLGVERGNSDLIIFLLLLIPVFKHESPKILAVTAVAAGVLKLFPIGALAGLMYHIRRSWKQTLFLLLCSGMVFLVYVFIMKENLLTVSEKTPRPFDFCCYGLGTVPMYLRKLFNLRKYTVWGPYLVLLTAGSMVFYFAARKKISALSFGSDKFGLAHIIGSGIFVTTCLIGYNWEYRLVFLILTIPQTLQWAKAKNALPALALALTILIMDQSFIEAQLTLLFPFNAHYILLSQFFAVLLVIYHLSLLIHFSMQRLCQLKATTDWHAD